MERHEILNYLGKEVVSLLSTFRDEVSVIYGNLATQIVFIPETNTIEIQEVTGDTLQYSLSEIEYIFKDNNKGFNICAINFQQNIRLEKTKLDFENGQISKDTFINHLGTINYSQYKCEKIYKRISAIQREVNTL